MNHDEARAATDDRMRLTSDELASLADLKAQVAGGTFTTSYPPSELMVRLGQVNAVACVEMVPGQAGKPASAKWIVTAKGDEMLSEASA